MSKDNPPTEAKTERFNMFMSPSEMKAIDDWAWKNKIRSKSEAVRRLCQSALSTEEAIEALDRIIKNQLVQNFQLAELSATLPKGEAIKEQISQVVWAGHGLLAVWDAFKDVANNVRTFEDLEKAIAEARSSHVEDVYNTTVEALEGVRKQKTDREG